MLVKCDKCGTVVPEEQISVINGESLCDDCSIIRSMQMTNTKCDDHSAVQTIKRATSRNKPRKQNA